MRERTILLEMVENYAMTGCGSVMPAGRQKLSAACSKFINITIMCAPTTARHSPDSIEGRGRDMKNAGLNMTGAEN